jgi:hypothetical protein
MKTNNSSRKSIKAETTSQAWDRLWAEYMGAKSPASKENARRAIEQYHLVNGWPVPAQFAA